MVLVKKSVSAINIDDNSKKTSEYQEPDMCPRCNTALRPEYISSRFSKFDGSNGQDRYNLWILHYCPKCRNCFLTEYNCGFADLNFRLQFAKPQSYPQSFVGKQFPDSIKSASARFVEIYNQSEQAENDGLSEVAGMGYRKSLEVLIIDYCLHKELATEEELEKRTLGQIINEKINDDRIKTTANRAAWLGNDHSHYFTKHTDRDIGDLKLLIQLTVNWIDNVLLTEKYEAEITKK